MISTLTLKMLQKTEKFSMSQGIWVLLQGSFETIFLTLCLGWVVATSSHKNVQKTENCHYQRFRKSIFDLKIISNPISKMLHMSDFGFTQFRVLFPKTVSTCSLKNDQKYWKLHFQILRAFVFDFKVASKPISKIFPLSNLKMKPFWRIWFAFLENGFNFVTQKSAEKKRKISHLNPQTIAFHLQVASKPLSKMLPTTSLDLIFGFIFHIFECFDFLLRKTSSVKNLQQVTLKISSKVLGDSYDENNFPHKLLLTNTQILKLRNAFSFCNKFVPSFHNNRITISKLIAQIYLIFVVGVLK